MASPLTFKTNKTMAIKKTAAVKKSDPPKKSAKKPLTDAQLLKQIGKGPATPAQEDALFRRLQDLKGGGAYVKLPYDKQKAFKEAQAKGKFASTVMAGGTKNPIYDPAKARGMGRTPTGDLKPSWMMQDMKKEGQRQVAARKASAAPVKKSSSAVQSMKKSASKISGSKKK